MSERHHLTRIGKYEVECVIGEGSMGVVYRAMDPLINRLVAIKVMADSVAQDVALRERFLREAQTAGSLQHPNVVTIYDFGEVDDHLFIAMEYVEGDDLADLLGKEVAIPIIEALDLTIGVLHGLAYAHKRGIIHRDIKPANIRVDGEGKARLMDFGVAHLASSDMTSTGMLLGTPAYMAPEQITGGSVTAETDIFSVGAVLYELLAGRRPFIGDTLQSLMYSILNRAPESLEAIVPKLPLGLHDIVMRSLQKEPSQRYHSAMAMANDLAAIRDSLDPEGKRTSLSLRAAIDTALAHEHRSQARRKRGRQVAIFAAGVLVTAGVFSGAWFLLRRTSSASPPAPSATSVLPSVTHDSVAVAPTPVATSGSSAQARTAPGRATASAPVSSAPASRDVRRGEKTAAVPLAAREADRKNTDSSAAIVAAPPRVASPLPPPTDRASAVTQQQQSSTSVAAPVAAPPPTVAAQPSHENVSEQVAAIIGAYARALESLDLNELRRVYPAMSAQQRNAFADFFRSIRTLKATLSVAGLQVDGASAEAQVTGTFDYVTTSGSTEQRNVRFVATLRRDRGVWALASVH
jgi:eukaryotic-like serine/threonine-protein kinase